MSFETTFDLLHKFAKELSTTHKTLAIALPLPTNITSNEWTRFREWRRAYADYLFAKFPAPEHLSTLNSLLNTINNLR